LKWFKHYTNAHKGEAILHLRPHFGKAEAYGLYFLFTEYFADKWDGNNDPTFKVLAFDLSSFLGLKQNKLRIFLECLQNEQKIKYVHSENVIEIKFPKLAEILHRDAVSSGQRPAKARPRSGPIKKRRDKNIHTEWQQKAFDLLVARYREYFPGTEIGGGALKRFCEHAKTEELAAQIIQAVTHYAGFLKGLTWDRQPKSSIATFLGAKDKPFWVEYKDPIQNTAALAVSSFRGA
jgi:hypothetical protein